MMVAAITVALVANLAPPARYDYEPRVPYHISYLPQQKIQRICASEIAAKADMALGCSLPELGLIYMTKGMRPEVRDIILRHEKAHINGWAHRGAHPFGTSVDVATRQGN